MYSIRKATATALLALGTQTAMAQDNLSITPDNRDVSGTAGSTDFTVATNLAAVDLTVTADTWTEATSAAGWSRRREHTSVVFDNKMWVMGGRDGGFQNDVWSSTDGINWTEATDAAAWPARRDHTSVAFDNKMWVIGGSDGSFQNDVWSSTDGETWTQVATTGNIWSGRSNHTSVVFDNKMWVIGGWDGSLLNDVWSSTDGITWTQATAAATWSARSLHTSVAFNNKMWVIGGDDPNGLNDVWHSTDGMTWTEATANAAWSARAEHTSVVFDNKMWVTGGLNADGFQDDVWNSTDGETWTQATADAAWSARSDHTSVVFDNNMWVIGGGSSGGSSGRNDVYFSEGDWLAASLSGSTLTADYEANGIAAPPRTGTVTISGSGLTATATVTQAVFVPELTLSHFNQTVTPEPGSTDFTVTTNIPSGDLAIAANTWTEATANAAWSERSNHTSVVFDNKMWVIGGDAVGQEDDVWSSTNGINWMEVMGDAGWPARSVHTSVVFNDRMWVIGGFSGDLGVVFQNDVWSSTDGITWTQAVANAAWSGRWGHTSVVFDNKMWVIGGWDGSLLNDVWSSTDGITWTQSTAAPWSARSSHTSVVFNNRMWVIGGNDGSLQNDVWHSTDGATWMQATANAAWSARSGHTSVVFNNKMWVIGGFGDDYQNDVWSSADGIDWIQAPDALWPGLSNHASVAFNNKIWVFGGDESTSSRLDHVYSSEGDWLTATSLSGSSPSYTLTANYDANEVAAFRAGTVTVSGRGLTQTATVIQEALTLSISPASQDVTAAEGSTDFTITTNIPSGELTIPSNAGGLTFTLTGTSSPYTLTVDYPINNTGASQTGTVTVSGRGLTETATLTQAAFTLSLIPANQDVTAATGSTNFTVTTDLPSPSLTITADTWTETTDDAAWSDRLGHTSVVFDNKMWVIGGIEEFGGIRKNDVWSSTDGKTWTQVTTTGTIWSARWGHTSVVFDNKIWVIGGLGDSRQNDVWNSTDGITWMKATDDADWSARYFHASVVFDNKMWVFGGNDGSNQNDVWSSTDGIIWTQATNAAWSERYWHTSVVFENKMWVIGGVGTSSLADAWCSVNGMTWTQPTVDVGWSDREGHTSVVYDDKMWVIGGTPAAEVDNAWCSTDGATWTQATDDLSSLAHRLHTSVVFDNKMWVMGGLTDEGGPRNDVLQSGVIWLRTAGLNSTGNELTATYDTNSMATPRTGTVIVGGMGVTATATVMQAEDTPELSLSPDQDVTAEAGSTNFMVTTNIPSGDLTIADNADWLALGGLNGTSSPYTLTATYDANSIAAPRIGTITVSGDVLTQMVTVTQEGADVLEFVDATFYDTDGNGDMDQVAVQMSERIDLSSAKAEDFTLEGGTVDVAINAPGGTVDATNTDAYFTLLVTLSGTAATALSYAPGGEGTSQLADLAGNEALANASITVVDRASPIITDLEIRDTAGDGLIDQILVTWSENIDTDTHAAPIIADVGTFTLPGGESASFHDHDISDPGGTVNTVLISNITGQLMPNTAVGATAISVPAEKWEDGAGNLNTADAGNMAGVTDAAGPAVTVEQGSGQTDPTARAQVVFDVVFSEPVIGFTGSDVNYTDTGSTGATALFESVDEVAPMNGTTYTLTVRGMAGTGEVTASIPADVATDAAGNTNEASTSTDNTVAYDVTAPDVTAPTVTIEQGSSQSDTTNVASVVFDIVFSEPVTGFEASDVDLAASTVAGTLTGTVSGSGTDYTLTVTGMTGDGMVEASVPASVALNAAGNLSEASTSTDNTVAYDITAPTVTIEQGSSQSDTTNVASVVFDIVFSEPVTGFEASDVDLSASTVGGTLTGMVTEVAPDGTTYTLEVTGMTGDGMVEASVSAGGATDAAGNTNESSTSTDNTVEYDMTAPTVTIDQASGQDDPTRGNPVFDVMFSEAVAGFEASDVDLTASTVGGTLTGRVTEVAPTDGTTYTLEVTGMTGDGVVTASILAGAATDAAGNEALASTRATVGYNDAAPPTVTIEQSSGQGDPTNADPVVFDVVFGEPVAGFDALDVDLTASEEPRALSGTVAVVDPTVAEGTTYGTTYTLEVTGMTRDGEVVASIAAGAARDAVGNFSQASTHTDNRVTYVHLRTTVGGLDLFPSVTWAGITAGEPTTFQITQDNLASDVTVKSLMVNITDGKGTAVLMPPYISENPVFPYNDFTHEFETAGEYTIEITMKTSTGETFDSTPTRKIQILETKPSNGYEESFESFEDGDTLNGWHIERVSLDGKANDLLSSWRRTDTIPGVGHHSGDYAIVTNALQDGVPGTYQPGEISFVYSPSFDFSGFTKPAISFFRLVMFQSTRDGAIFQASTDDGRTWNNVGAYSRFGFSGWHNSESIISAPGIVAPGPLSDGVDFDDAGIGWTEDGSEGRNDDRWVEARADLSGYGGIRSVRFRFALSSDNREKDEDNVGFGFDNVGIFEQRRTVLVEQFSSSLDPNSITLDAMLNTYYSEDDFVVRMNYFTDLANTNGNRDPLNQRNADDPGGRIERYGVGGVPSLALAGNMIDGSRGPFGALIPSDLDEAYARLAHEKLGNPLFTINIDASIDDTSLYVGADFISNTDQLDDPGTELGLHIAILEPEVVINGETVTNVLRKMLPDAAGQYVRGKFPKDTVLHSRQNWLITHVDDADTLVVVAFIQDVNTHQVYQAAVKGVSGGQEAEVLGVEGPAHVTVYPNPGSAQVTVDFGDMAREQKEWMLFDPTGQTVRFGAVARGEATLVIDTQGLSSGMYIFRAVGEGRKAQATKQVVIRR